MDWNQFLNSDYIDDEEDPFDGSDLVPYRGRCPFLMYIASKLHRNGIKIWVLCDAETFYVYKMQVYLGKDRSRQVERDQGEREVLQPVEGLQYRNVTCDNFFTSHSLALALRQHKMIIVGTIRKNRKELPPILLDMKRKPIQHSEFVFDHTNKVSLVSYVPKKIDS